MTATPFCPSCGQYTASLPDNHTPEQCAQDKRRETYAHGAAAARAALEEVKDANHQA